MASKLVGLGGGKIVGRVARTGEDLAGLAAEVAGAEDAIVDGHVVLGGAVGRRLHLQ